MITRLRVKNYLSLRDVDIVLGKRNVLVGPNMSGKTNLIDCLKFLTNMVSSGLNKAFLDRGGFSEVVWKGGVESRISVQVTIEDREAAPELVKIYDYELSVVGSPTGLISVERERLEIRVGDQVSTLIDLENGHGRVTHLDGGPAFEPPGPGRSALEFAVPGWEGTSVRDFMTAWRFYRLIPSQMRQSNLAVGQQFLNEDGSNFSSWFMTLQTGYPDAFRLIKQAATDVLPDIEEILIPPTQFATTHMLTRERPLKRPVSIWRMSDGELMFLAWLSLILAPDDFGAPLFCAEEPENHLHPRLLETLVELHTQRQHELSPHAAQVILTTHSPYLVDRMNLADLIVVERKKGATHYTRPASKSHLKELLEREELGLGELWYSGALGGT
jgi:predicted ATPase